MVSAVAYVAKLDASSHFPKLQGARSKFDTSISETGRVGTDLVWNALTKVVGATVHYRKGNVNAKLVRCLALGSIPGALLGLFMLGLLKTSSTVTSVDKLIVRLLGGTLIAVAFSIVLRGYVQNRFPFKTTRLISDPNLMARTVPLIGFVVGVLVTFTSVGSGSLIMTSLLLLFPGERLNKLVGSDVFTECCWSEWRRWVIGAWGT